MMKPLPQSKVPHSRIVDQGFTLVEMLLVLALLALLGGLVVTNIDGLLSGLGQKPLPEILRDAVREARFQAAFTKEPVFLVYDEESAALRLITAANNELSRLSTGYDPKKDRVRVKFYQILPFRGAEVTGRYEHSPTPYVTFHPDRSSMPFEVELEAEGITSLHRYDPFSDVELEEK